MVDSVFSLISRKMYNDGLVRGEVGLVVRTSRIRFPKEYLDRRGSIKAGGYVCRLVMVIVIFRTPARIELELKRAGLDTGDVDCRRAEPCIVGVNGWVISGRMRTVIPLIVVGHGNNPLSQIKLFAPLMMRVEPELALD